MRFVSLRLIAACILLPPLLYALTMAGLQRALQARLADQVETIYLGDTRRILDGSVPLKRAIKTNIERYAAAQPLLRHGVSLRVTVASKSGAILYPAFFETEERSEPASDAMAVATENFSLLNDGLAVQVEATVEHNRLLSNAILAFFILASLMVFVIHLRGANRRALEADTASRRELEQLMQRERENTRSLEELLSEREKLRNEFERFRGALESERSRALQNEEDLIEEIGALEAKLSENAARDNERLQEIESLRERIAEFEKDQRREEKYRLKTESAVRRRFDALYKNLAVNERAVRGFVELGEELKLKAEEVIQQLNHAPDLVTVKRKVFGKKNRETVFEVVFAYKGRLYFRRGADRKIEVLAVGTKNTQTRELEFLASL
jgi:hypothetical protein